MAIKSLDVSSPLSQEHKERQALIDTFWDYYRGKHKKHIKPKLGQPDDNVILNHSRTIVNMGMNFLVADGVQFEIDADTEERTKEEAYLDTVYDDDPLNNFNLNDWLQGVALSGAVTGTPFVRLYPAGGYPGRKDLPSLVTLDTANVDVVTDPDDMNRAIEYHVVWKSVGDIWKRHRFMRNDAGAWDYVSERMDKSTRWTVEETAVWDYTWAPIFHCQNLKNPRDFWGISDLEDADINDGVNFVASNMHRIVRYHAHPRTLIFGVDTNQFKATGVDQTWTIANENGRAENLEMQSDLASSREHLGMLKRDYFHVTDTPQLDPTQVSVGALSGFALKILYGPLLSKTQNKRIRYGGMLARINYALLELAGLEPQVVKTMWSDPLPGNEREKADLFAAYVNGGASIFGAAKLAGYSDEEANLLADTTTLPEIEL